jgi:hypothetical protein
MYRKEFYLTALIMVCTMTQLWAFLVVLRSVRPDGTPLLALAVTLVSAAVAVINGWRYVFRGSRSDQLYRAE